jgi:hypothetical protein
MEGMTDACEFRRLPGIDLYLWLRLVLAALLAAAGVAWALV